MPSVLPIIIVSAIIPIVLVAVILGTLMKKQAATDRLLKTGVPARGRILQLGTTGGSVAVMGHRHLKLILTVEVQPQSGAPYVATFEQLISELQVPSVQPGATIELRVDPQNPMKMALAGVVPQGMQQQQGWGAQGNQGGFAPAPVMGMGVSQPNYKSSIPFILIMLFVTTVPVTVVLLYTFGSVNMLGFSSSSGGDDGADDESEGDKTEKKKKKKSGTTRARRPRRAARSSAQATPAAIR